MREEADEGVARGFVSEHTGVLLYIGTFCEKIGCDFSKTTEEVYAGAACVDDLSAALWLTWLVQESCIQFQR